jgi:hypothetical protein
LFLSCNLCSFLFLSLSLSLSISFSSFEFWQARDAALANKASIFVAGAPVKVFLSDNKCQVSADNQFSF